MHSQSGMDIFWQGFGIIVCMYIAFLAICAVVLNVKRNRARQTARQTLWFGGIPLPVKCDRCRREVMSLWHIGNFGPYCYGCCVNFARASEQPLWQVRQIGRQENDECP